MIDVYAVKLEDFSYDKLIPFISKEKKQKIYKFRRYDDVKRSLAADILLRYIICNRLKIKNHEIKIVKNEFGKPSLLNESDFHFNVSHSGEWVVCSIHSMPLGIDIEKIQPIDLEIANTFFSKEEYNQLVRIKNEGERLYFFYDLWTLKESYIKAVGKGLYIPLNSFTIKKLNENNIHITTAEKFVQYNFKQYTIDENYKLSLCALLSNFTPIVVKKSLIDIYYEISTNF